MSSLTTLFAPARRPQLVHMCAVVALLAACSVAPGGSPTPVASPEPSDTPAPSDNPAPTPSPTFRPDDIPHPTGQTDIVLRLEEGGGFVPLEWNLTNAPQFTLYGDGTVVFRPQQDEGEFAGDPGLPRFLTGTMTEEGIQALLQFALTTGRLAMARESYDDPMLADATTTTFVLNAGDAERVVSVYALSELVQPGPDAADRQGFFQLANLLRNFEAEAESGTVDEPRPYDAEFYRVVLLEGMGEPVAEPIEWPWDDLTPDDFVGGDEPGKVKVLTREQVAELTEVPSGGQFGIWVNDPDGDPVQVAVRPLLPEEAEAAGL